MADEMTPQQMLEYTMRSLDDMITVVGEHEAAEGLTMYENIVFTRALEIQRLYYKWQARRKEHG